MILMKKMRVMTLILRQIAIAIVVRFGHCMV